MWKMVERCTADGTLEALRNGNLATGIPVGNRKPAPEKPTWKRQGENGPAGSKVPKSAAPQERDEESDGGFFEK